MKSVIQKFVAVLLLAGMSLAQTAAPASAPAKRTKHAAAKHATKAPAVTQDDIKALRDMIQAQQQQIEQMRQEMARRDQQIQQTQQQLADTQTAAKEAQSKTAALESSANDTKQSFATVQSDVADLKTNMTNTAATTQEEQKRIGTIESAAKRFRWGGDVRVRFDAQSQEGVQARYRPRIRVRFGVDGQLNEDFTAGLALASGNLNDPTSSNATFGDSFQRKPVSIDRGYITYNPVAHKWLSITGGKFAYTWNRTNQTFDPDINPEGFSEKLSFDVKNSPVVKNLTLVGLQLMLNETNNTANSYAAVVPKFSTDSWAVGGQVSSKLQFGEAWTMTPSYTVLNFRNPDYLVNGYASLVQGGTPLPNAGNFVPVALGATTIFAPNGMTNALCPETIGAATNVPKFCSGFLYSDLILNNVIKTPVAKLPLNLLGEYEVNLNAASNRSHLYQVEASLGQTKNKNDVQFGYAFTRSEQDAVIASFAESDQRFPSNVLQHRIFGGWKISPNTTLMYTQWIGRALSTTLANTSAYGFGPAPDFKPYGFGPTTVVGGHEPWVKRGQLDLIYTF